MIRTIAKCGGLVDKKIWAMLPAAVKECSMKSENKAFEPFFTAHPKWPEMLLQGKGPSANAAFSGAEWAERNEKRSWDAMKLGFAGLGLFLAHQLTKERQGLWCADGGKNLTLVINCGSSSLKYGVFELKANGDLDLICSGLIDKIGLDGTVIKHEVGEEKTKLNIALKDHASALKKLSEMLTAAGGPVKNIRDIKVVGHRVVHGGPTFSEPTIVDASTEKAIEECNTLAPLHNPVNLQGIRLAKEVFASSKQVAVFDTAFHSTMPPESYRYAVPKYLYEKHHVRRYGFHGTSYKYIVGAVAEKFGRPAEELNMIIFHLGNGASAACVKNGKVLDTTMGLTPLEGLVMGTRSGDIDAGVYTYLTTGLGMTPQEVDTILNKKSGLLGVCGKSDMREVIEAAGKGDVDAMLARRLVIERLRKFLGAFLVKLDGKLDVLVFTAGMGESDHNMRETVCSGLSPLGIDIDPAKNRVIHAGGAVQEGEVQSTFSRAKIMILPTQEELSIAQQSLVACGFIKQGAKK